jgi:exopolysaccharide biosynthesis protein
MPHAIFSVKNRLIKELVGVMLLASPLIVYGSFHISRPALTDSQSVLFSGISYRHLVDRSLPRPVSIHIVEIDLKTSGIEVFVTPFSSKRYASGTRSRSPYQIQARTTSEFLEEFDLQLAINGNFFYPFREKTPWDYYPQSGDGVNLVGLAISNGQTYSKKQAKYPALCFSAQQIARIVDNGDCPLGTVQAIAGNQILINRGSPVTTFSNNFFYNQPYPRTVAATNSAGDKLWLFIIDGKQPFYSEGVTIPELTQIVSLPGIDRAVNLDGGGSTTLAVASPTGARLLNSPIQNKLPMQERPIANHLGFRAARK